eukprot:1126531-Rhodomonas_salina.3
MGWGGFGKWRRRWASVLVLPPYGPVAFRADWVLFLARILQTVQNGSNLETLDSKTYTPVHSSLCTEPQSS